jgi:hypothetical protein
MRKLPVPLFVIVLSALSFFLNAQSPQSTKAPAVKAIKTKKNYSSIDWLRMMRDPSVNIHDVQKAFYKWDKVHNKADKDKDKAIAKKGENEEADGAHDFFKRWEWYNLPRANNDGSRPDIYKITKDYQDYLKHSPVHASARPAVHPVSTGAWTYAGNTAVPGTDAGAGGNGGDGRVNHVRVMPGNNSIMFACSPSGGLWETTNGGTSWSTNTDQLGDLTTSDIAINPSKTNIMYLATGDYDGIQSIYPTPGTIGVLKSYNGGVTWTATSLSYSMSTAGADFYAISELIIDPTDTAVIIASSSFGIWRSANSGLTWTKEESGWFHSIEFHPGNHNIVYAGASSLYDGGGLFYRSMNNGVTWTNITSGLPSSTNAEGFEVAVTAADTADVYVLADAASDNSFYGLYLSTNHGTSFATQSTTPDILGWDPGGAADGGQGWYTLSLAVSQTNADSVMVGGVNIWSSSNGGSTWKLNANWEDGAGSSSYVHADIHSIQPIPGTNSKGYVVGCDGGVFITSTNSTKWTDISSNLEIAQQYCVGASALTAGEWITGWQDNGTYLNKTAPNVSQTMGGDGMDCFISWASNNDMFAETGEGGLEYSTNGGTDWNNPNTLPTDANTPWVAVQVQDPKTAADIYTGFEDVWKSTDGGNNYTTKLSTWGATAGGTITAIAVDSVNPSYIYASQANIIEYTANGGTSWTNITTGALNTAVNSGGASISGIALNSKKPSHIWVTLQGYDAGNEVYYSSNYGATWTNISSGLPNLPVNCVVSESGSPNGVYIGTDQGVYYKDTTMATWVFYNTGLPLVMVGDLAIYQPGKQLIAATYGRGTWSSTLFTATAPVAYFKGVDTNVCKGSTVTFTDTSVGSPTAWKWTFTGGNPATATTQTVAVTYTATGTYAVKMVVSNSNGKDSLTKATYIVVNAPPTANTSVTDNVFCKGESTGSASASASGGASPYTYLWTGGGGNAANATGLAAGNYTVTVTDKNGCTGTASAVITQPANGVTVSASLTGALSCNGDDNASVSSSPSGGTSPYTYSWSGGGTNATESDLSAGVYTITIQDASGCLTSSTVTVPQPVAMDITTYSLTSAQGACNGEASVTIVSGGTAPYTYKWSNAAGSTTDTIKDLCVGNYCCVVTDNNGCTETTCVNILTGINNISNASNINIYPDPNAGSFTVAGVIQGQVIELYNAIGQQLSSATVDKPTMYFNIATQADGIYLVRILNKDGTLVTQKKIVKAQEVKNHGD